MAEKDILTGIEAPEDRRKKLYDKWQQYIDNLEDELSRDVNPFESVTLQKMLMISNHFHSHESRRTANLLNDLLHEKHIKDLSKAQKPGWKEVAPIVIQLISAIGGAVLGIVPVAAGLGNNASAIMNTLSQGANTFGVGGSQAVGGVVNSSKQNQQTVANFELEESKRQQQDAEQSRRQREETMRRHHEDISRAEEKRHQLASQFNN